MQDEDLPIAVRQILNPAPQTSPHRLREMPFRERASRASLQIALELPCCFCCPEFQRYENMPRSIARRVFVLSGVVPVESRRDVRRQAYIVATPNAVTAEHVDESFVGMHTIACGTNRSAQKCRRSSDCLGIDPEVRGFCGHPERLRSSLLRVRWADVSWSDVVAARLRRDRLRLSVFRW
jgi:hypothetical protein